MCRAINSSELARQVSEILKLSQEDGLKLYKELSQMPNGPVKDALEGLVEALEDKAGDKKTDIRYAACIRGSSVRDAQYEKAANSNPLDDDVWVDAEDMPLFLKIIEAATPPRAVQIAAAYAGVEKEVIELFPMGRV